MEVNRLRGGFERFFSRRLRGLSKGDASPTLFLSPVSWSDWVGCKFGDLGIVGGKEETSFWNGEIIEVWRRFRLNPGTNSGWYSNSPIALKELYGDIISLWIVVDAVLAAQWLAR